MSTYLAILLNARAARLEQRGASAVEYGLLVAGLVALLIVVLLAFGAALRSVFTQTCNTVAGNGTPNACR